MRETWIAPAIALALMTPTITGCTTDHTPGQSTIVSAEPAPKKTKKTTPSKPPEIPLTEPPAAAKAAGYTKLIFHEPFTTAAAIDMQNTGAKEKGYTFFVDRPWDYPTMQSSEVQIMQDSPTDSFVRIKQQDSRLNWGISTMHYTTLAGWGFQQGYFEATMRWQDPAAGKDLNDGWPSFWLESAAATVGTVPHHAELDIMEAYRKDSPWTGNISTIIHDWQNGNDISNEGSNRFFVPTPSSQEWHRYGCLWTPQQVTWFFDGEAKITQKITPGGTYDILNHEPKGMTMIIGGATNQPVDVTDVAVWSGENTQHFINGVMKTPY